MTDQTQNQEVQQPDVDVTFKLSFVNALIRALDEVPHKWSRNVIDALSQATSTQLQERQQTLEQPEGPLGSKVVQ